MKREIKFRAWDKNLCILISEDEMTGKREFSNGRNTISSILDNEDYIVSFSLIKNKYGVHVFDGDIITGKGFRSNKRVIIKDGFYSLENFNPIFFSIDLIKNCKVIGNVFENPELLTK